MNGQGKLKKVSGFGCQVFLLQFSGHEGRLAPATSLNTEAASLIQ